MRIGPSLRRARREAGLTQAALADRAGTSQATIAQYETGRKTPSSATLARLLGACGVQLVARPIPGRRTLDDLQVSGERLADVLELAEALPYRPRRRLDFPRLVRRAPR